MKIKNRSLALGASLILASSTYAAMLGDSFVINAIQVHGLKRVSVNAVLSHIPVHKGDHFDPNISNQIINQLYSTGLFEDVRLARLNNTLIINVIERSVIGSIKISGNKKLKKDEIEKVFKDAGQGIGDIYDRAAIESIKQNLKDQYAQMSKYNVSIDIVPEIRNSNSVIVKVIVNEGLTAKIHKIVITGNHDYSTGRLIRQLKLTTPRLWTFITKTDEYSKDKLDASVEALKSFYMDRGYIHFKVNSADAHLSDNKNDVIVTFDITEGSRYKFSGYKFSGNTILSSSELAKQVTFSKGDVFSRKAILETNDALGVAIGDKGYAFAQIEPIPEIDENTKQVFINFFVNPGHQIYVRRINFSGNTITADYVLRHAVQQMEGGLVSVSKIRESIRQLNLLGYFKDVQIKSTPVAGTDNQVDLDYSVKETNAGTASVNFSYSTLTKFGIGAGINQPNFMGTGRTVGFNFSRDAYITNYSINYYNPYFTNSGIGFGALLSYQKTRPNALNISDFALDNYGATFYYNIPMTLNNTLQLGYGFSRIHLGTNIDPNTGLTTAPTEIIDFISKYGNDFDQITLESSWTYNGQDRAIFPTEGFEGSLGANVAVPAFKHTLKYYKLNSSMNYLQPLERKHDWILSFAAGAGYGNGYDGQTGLPFFNNYYAGGISQGMSRAFDSASLGPLDSNGKPIGGNLLLYGTIGLIFPNYISDSIRTSLFVDGANVYQTDHYLKQFDLNGAGPIRYSAGLALTWRSPVGPISVSLAEPINKQPTDQRQLFQFTMGTSF